MKTKISQTLTGRLNPLRNRILAGDNSFCFIERQKILADCETSAPQEPASSRYAFVLEQLLDRSSTPVESDDVFLGRLVEGPCPDPALPPPKYGSFMYSVGHTTLNWPELLAKGLSRIGQDIRARALLENTGEGTAFAVQATRCIDAVLRYAARYAAAARQMAATASPEAAVLMRQAAAALEACPAGPALDFFSALQSIWLVDLVTSCHIGARDFAFGRMDQYLLPYYREGLRDGSLTPELARLYLSHFFLKTKEITGTAGDSFRIKPVPCYASNHYVTIGGMTVGGQSAVNELSVLILDAVQEAAVPQPEINVRWAAHDPQSFKQAVARSMVRSGTQIQLWNEEAILATLARDYPAISLEDARDYSFTACNRINFPGKDYPTGWEQWHMMPRWLMDAMRQPEAGQDFESLLSAFQTIAYTKVAQSVKKAERQVATAAPLFFFESILLKDCPDRVRDLTRGGLRYLAQYHLFGGLATVADSLTAIRQLVFEEKRLTLPQMVEILDADFVGHESLREEIIHRLPKFGNDLDEVDSVARQVGDIVCDAVDAARHPGGHLLFPALYSLYLQVPWGGDLTATPDGRRRGEPFSENQSPVHGADRQGITALLKSVARLPHHRTVMGGLNLVFGGHLPPATFIAMVDSFFALGGVHLGLTLVDRKALIDARKNPKQHPSLCVRVTGFSEYFVALSPAIQDDVIARTGY